MYPAPIKVLVADDSAEELATIYDALDLRGCSVITAHDGLEALGLARRERPDLIVLDVNMPKLDGLQTTSRIKSDPELRFTPVVLLTANSDSEAVTKGLASGADDYITKPFRRQELYARLDAALRARNLYKQLQQVTATNNSLKAQLEALASSDNIVGRSPKITAIREIIAKVGRTDVPVLIFGESGTGKELVARAVHQSNSTRKGPFVAQNCSVFNEQLLESELFGHTRGAFTGADREKIGLFEVADGGTFFLDEVAEMSPALQAKLLRVLQEGSFYRVGSTEERKVDLRVVAATNRDLNTWVKDGRFREDLLYRLNLITITLPPLRERMEDLPLLIDHFLALHRAKGRTAARSLSEGLLQQFRNYAWPGNIRQLFNELERLCIFDGDSSVLSAAPSFLAAPSQEQLIGLPPATHSNQDKGSSAVSQLARAKNEVESRLIREALTWSGGNLSKAARLLGISRTTLTKKRRELGL